MSPVATRWTRRSTRPLIRAVAADVELASSRALELAVLSGGAFQNRRLLALTRDALTKTLNGRDFGVKIYLKLAFPLTMR